MALVHQADEGLGRALAEQYEVADWPWISDPERKLYRAFGLEHGTLGQVLGAKSLLRGAGVLLSGGHSLLRKQVGSLSQMPGAFVLESGRVTAEYRHESVADRPDYLALLDGARAGAA